MKQYPFYSAMHFRNFRDFLDGIGAFGDKPAVCTFDRAGTPTVRSFRQLCRDVACLRKALQELGLAQKRAAIAGENSYAWIVAYLAVVSGSGVAICLDINQDSTALADNVKKADGDYAFTTPDYQYAIEYNLRWKQGRNLFYLTESKNPEIPDVDSLIASGSRTEEDAPVPERNAPGAVLFTSGTTAVSKAVVLTQQNLLENVGNATAVFDLGNNVYSGVPLFHAYGMTCGLLSSMMCGAMFTVTENIRFMMRDARLCEAVTFLAVPVILDTLLKTAEDEARKNGKAKLFRKICSLRGGRCLYSLLHRKKIDKLRQECFGSLRMIVTGGAYMNAAVCRKVQNFGILVFPGYGITECSPLVSVNRPHFFDTSTVGTVLPGFEIKFANGEILLRGSCVMQGYYNDPEATGKVIDGDGWFHTGDLGEMTPEGNLRITGRIKKQIVFKNGKKISPEKVENQLRRYPLIQDVIVTSAPFGEGADDVVLAVSVFPNPELTRGKQSYQILGEVQKIVDRINENVPAYQQIRIINIQTEAFQKTATGKTIL